MDGELNLGDGLRARVLAAGDADLLVEGTSAETGTALWGPRPVGPYTARDAATALAAWDPAAGGQLSVGVLRDGRLLGAVGLMPDGPGSAEVAYWVRPEARRAGLATRALRAVTPWAHGALGAPRLWLEIDPANTASVHLAERAGYVFEQRLPRHCRAWTSDDPERDTWHDCLVWVHDQAD